MVYLLNRCRKMKKYIIVSTSILIILLMVGVFVTRNILGNHYRPVKLKYVVVHIDLKGAPPKLSFLKLMLPEIRKLGANALLMEYEDMFPYQNKLVNLSKPKHYKRTDLKGFLIEANRLGFEIIPLIQTFGHMEFVLKQKDFMHLRENPKFPDSICPSKLESFILISEILRQVIEFHNSIVPLNYIHIGCDEVFHINTCGNCRTKHLNKYDIFAKHVDLVSNIVSTISFNTIILIWDDMLRGMEIGLWKNFTMNPKLELVYWDYSINISAHRSMFYYHHHFQGLWVASAFKGADGAANAIPNYKMRTSNTLSWLNFIQNYIFGGEKEVYSFEGIILTGWSRYAHLQPLVEFLPVSYQSLITSLLLINKYKKGIRQDVIDWNTQSGDIVFNQYFLDDYYELVGCKTINPKPKEIDTCLLNSTILLYDSVKRYEFFLENTTSEEINALMKIEYDNNWCAVIFNRLWFIEDIVKWNMKPFFGSEVISEYLKKSYLLKNHLIMCPNSYLKNIY